MELPENGKEIICGVEALIIEYNVIRMTKYTIHLFSLTTTNCAASRESWLCKGELRGIYNACLASRHRS
jgi:hypothetical protein